MRAIAAPVGAANSVGFRSEASAAVPIPVAVRPNNCRRVSSADSRSGSMSGLGDQVAYRNAGHFTAIENEWDVLIDPN